MKTIRTATYNDKDAIKKLWELCFTDSKNFRDWLFNNRYLPDYSTCVGVDNLIVATMQSNPVSITVRDSIFNSVILAGVSTHPDHRGKGYMKELFKFHMNLMHDMGIVFTAHTPAKLDTYFYAGHFPVSDAAFLDAKNTSSNDIIKDVFDVDPISSISGLLKCYRACAAKFSGMVNRSYSDFLLKTQDYMSDGGKCLVHMVNNSVEGYVFYYDTENMIYGEEFISLTKQSELLLIESLTTKASNKKVKIKLNPQITLPKEVGVLTVAPRNVLGLANASKALSILGKNTDFVIDLKDNIVKANNNIFNFKGDIVSLRPDLSMSCGHFTQWITGYKSLDELIKDNSATIFDNDVVKELNVLFPKLRTRIIDEY